MGVRGDGACSIACGWNARSTTAGWPTRMVPWQQRNDALGLIRLTPVVLRRAGLPMPTAVKTLDAIHLSERACCSRSSVRAT